MKHSIFSIIFAVAANLVVAAEPEPLNFNRDIRPILSAKCFSCHGPDSQERDAEYRLDTEEGAFADLGGYAGITPGDPKKSEVYFRITADADDDDLMPPSKHKNPLTPAEIELITRWIEEGAPYAGHWAFEPVSRPEPPAAEAETRNSIDHFIAERLEQKGLTFSPEAAPETLVRRLHLDLTGLPPAAADIDAFLENPNAEFEATIERLMESPHFAERLALEWLDVARFADTNGYSIDDHRDMWGWRDWVIYTFQNNLPYDEFIRQQIAGDLFENATDHQKIATGFLRNSMNTHEGGTIAEEYRVAYVADKIDTVSTAFMGLTMKCAQCHDHKYDAISQRDYYRFFAFFNTSSESGKGATNGNTKPFLAVEPILQNGEEFKATVERRIAALEQLRANPEPFIGDAQSKWEDVTLASLQATDRKDAGPAFRVPKDGEAKGLSWIWANKAGAGQFAWFRKTFPLESVPEHAQLFVSCDNEAEIWINGKKLGKNPDWREPSVFEIQQLLVEGENLIAIAGKDWQATGGKAALVALAAFSDGTYIGTEASWLVSDQQLPKWNQLEQPEGFKPATVVAAHGAGPWGNTFARVKQSDRNLAVALSKPRAERTLEERRVVTDAFAKTNSDVKKLASSISGEIGVLRKSLESGKTTVMVMDQAANRETPVLIRGAYDQHGEIVDAGIPAVFGELNSEAPNRLDLANWLTDPSNPLTARVVVNRYWQMIFGTGIVKTSEDFGSQGEWPSHPELLDWLAAEFVESGWDVRQLLKTMLMSRTYRQSSDVDEQLLAADPFNRLHARAARYRLTAEFIRDGALSIGGLLDREIGGPSVYPPQPGGLWREVSHFGHPTVFTAQHHYPDRDEPAFRRSLYTFWKRTAPPPVMSAFDAPNRETCAVRRSLTNTPMQALVLMNEPQFVEAARGLAKRMMDSDDQIRHGFRLATARQPSAEELEILRAAYERQLKYFGDAEDPEFAAMSTVASLILNLDETITRE